jgi:molybdopterin converting factor small subunit
MKILAFAGARARAGFAELETAVEPTETPREIVGRVAPQLGLAEMRAAIDCEYWEWDKPVGTATELAIIPPVSGG